MNKIMGLDLGARTCGVALSDSLGLTASPLTTLRFRQDDYQTALEQVGKLIDEHQVKTVVLGLPRHMNGDIGERGEISQQFAENLKAAREVEVVLWDERLTTVQAQKTMIDANMNRRKRREMVDAMAAALILESYLDSRN